MRTTRLQAGAIDELRAGNLLTIDLGFAEQARSSAWAMDDRDPECGTFAMLRDVVLDTVKKKAGPVAILIEAPLSMAFNKDGNPTARAIEIDDQRRRRNWYSGPGASVLVAAAHLLGEMAQGRIARDVYIFEGFKSFRIAGERSDHRQDVRELRAVARGDATCQGGVVQPQYLPRDESDELRPLLSLLGFKSEIPAVVFAGKLPKAIRHRMA